MRKMFKYIMGIGLGVIFSGLISACHIRAALPPPTATSVPILLPTQTQTQLPSQTPTLPVIATAPFAPVCDPGMATPTPLLCAEITARETSVFCTDKKPFNIIFINKGYTYKALTPGFYCTAGGVRENQQIITCTGIMASTYQVQICDPACVLPTVEAQVTQCPAGSQFDAQMGCCAQGGLVRPQNCRVFEFHSGTCVVNCGVYTKKKTCNQNTVACLWVEDTKTCVARR